MGTIQLEATCPHCKNNIKMAANVDAAALAPSVHAKLKPAGSVLVYKISTDDMKVFITQKARKYCPDVKIDMIPRYCEKRRRHKSEPHRAYASLRIAFSEHIIEKKDDLGWYGKIGESSENLRIQPSMFQNLFQMYRYDPKNIDAWLKSYKNLEELEDALGINEEYINELKLYARPQRIFAENKESWIIFSAAAENVIADMLTDTTTQRPAGRIEIRDIYPISKDNVEFLVYVHPQEVQMTENPHVRQILTGEEKPKK